MNYSGFQLGHPEITYTRESAPQSDVAGKLWAYCQRIIAATALVSLSPLIAIMWILVRSTSSGPFLFRQERPGLGGSNFYIYKVRTMRPGNETGTALGVSNSDSRVTTIGKVLRVLKLDELPQLWNVLRGEMTLVGPRPIPTALDTELRSKIPGFAKRYQVQPGLTSIGQICIRDNALGDSLVADWKLRFEGERHYIKNRCFSYDVVLIAMTSLYVFKMLLEKLSSKKADQD